MPENIPTVPFNFLGLPARYSDYQKSKFVVLPIPYEQTTTFKSGTREGPRAIIAASLQVELFDEELQFEPYKAGIATLNELETTALGPEKMTEKIHQVARTVIKDEKIPVMLGGEHSITLGLVKALKEKYKDLTVLQLDAHADLRDSYQENKQSHACIMRRIREICPAVQVGIRNLSSSEYEFVTREKIKLFYAHQIRTGSNWQNQVTKSLSKNVFLTLDLDFFDPSIMPAVGTPEPGGLLWYDTLNFLQKIIYTKNLVGFDVVELSPLPGNIASDFMAARLVYKLIGFMSKAYKFSRISSSFA